LTFGFWSILDFISDKGCSTGKAYANIPTSENPEIWNTSNPKHFG
jgi:hypothetical protein